MPTSRLTPLRRPASAVVAAALAMGLAGCMFGGGETTGLAPGLVAQMDQPGATLDRGQAIGLINSYRASAGAPAVSEDTALDAEAQQLAGQYAGSGQAPQQPADVSVMRVSGGYGTFAETFSGWRNSPQDAAALADRGVGRAGIAVVYNPNSGYGVHWVLLLAK